MEIIIITRTVIISVISPRYNRYIQYRYLKSSPAKQKKRLGQGTQKIIMKHNNAKQYAGLWLDNAKAILIANTPDNAEYSIQDKVKAEGKHGGGSEHSMNNAKQSENLKYFKDIAGLLSNYDEILVFGPGQSQEQFQNFLKEDARFQNKKITIDSDEQLTDPQMIAKVRDHFKGHQA